MRTFREYRRLVIDKCVEDILDISEKIRNKDEEDMTVKIRKGREKDYIVIMVNKSGKEFARLDYPTEKAARAAIHAGKFFGSAGMSFKLEKGDKSIKV